MIRVINATKNRSLTLTTGIYANCQNIERLKTLPKFYFCRQETFYIVCTDKIAFDELSKFYGGKIGVLPSQTLRDKNDTIKQN